MNNRIPHRICGEDIHCNITEVLTVFLTFAPDANRIARDAIRIARNAKRVAACEGGNLLLSGTVCHWEFAHFLLKL